MMFPVVILPAAFWVVCFVFKSKVMNILGCLSALIMCVGEVFYPELLKELAGFPTCSPSYDYSFSGIGKAVIIISAFVFFASIAFSILNITGLKPKRKWEPVPVPSPLDE